MIVVSVDIIDILFYIVSLICVKKKKNDNLNFCMLFNFLFSIQDFEGSWQFQWKTVQFF